MYYLANIISRIKATSKEKGITQTYLCRCIGKRPTFINEVASGKDKLDEYELAVIAKELGTTPEYLKGESDEVKPKSTLWDIIDINPTKRQLVAEIANMSDEDLIILSSIIKRFKNEDK